MVFSLLWLRWSRKYGWYQIITIGCNIEILWFLSLSFIQKEDLNLSKDQSLKLNREEVKHYEETLKNHNTKYQILDIKEESDGSITIYVRKQINDSTDVAEYFN